MNIFQTLVARVRAPDAIKPRTPSLFEATSHSVGALQSADEIVAFDPAPATPRPASDPTAPPLIIPETRSSPSAWPAGKPEPAAIAAVTPPSLSSIPSVSPTVVRTSPAEPPQLPRLVEPPAAAIAARDASPPHFPGAELTSSATASPRNIEPAGPRVLASLPEKPESNRRDYSPPPAAPLLVTPSTRLVTSPAPIASAPNRAPEPTPAPAIHVTIGRVEVRADVSGPNAAPAAAPAKKNSPVISLEDYLRDPTEKRQRK